MKYKRKLLAWFVVVLAAVLAAVFYERSAGVPEIVYVEVVLLLAVFFLFLAYAVYAAVQIFKIRNRPEFKLALMVESLTVALLLASVWLVLYFVLRLHSGPPGGT